MPLRNRRSHLLAALAGTAMVLAGGAAARPSAAAAAPSCATIPSHVTVVQKDAHTLAVSWRPPPGVRRRLVYRVARGGHVVGQTKGRFMVVRVRPGKLVKIRIGVIEGRARKMRCAAVVRVRTQLRNRASLAAPATLEVTEVNDRRVRLRWGAVSGAFGYRVLRDDLVVRQVRETSLDVDVVGGKPYTFQIAPVDRAGRVGAMSRLVQVATVLSPPRPPTGLTAQSAGGGAYRVSWRPASAGSFGLAGYRVLRDGQPLGQDRDTSRVVTGLVEGEVHRVTVVTVDRQGQLSPESAPIELQLDPPPPTTGTARAFLLASTDRSFEDFKRNYMRVGRIYPTYFDCTADARFVGADDPRITRWARARRVLVMPRINCQNTATLHRILTEPAIREAWLSKIVEVTRTYGYDGVNIDFEAGLWTDRAALSDFVTEAVRRLRAEGRLVSICVSAKQSDTNKQHPRNGIFDYPVLAGQVDEILVMSWGWHWLTSTAGEISPLSWLQGVAQYVSTMPNRDRFVMGTSMYGIDWPEGSGTSKPGTPYEYDDMLALIARVGAAPVRDPSSGEMTFTYYDAGVRHDVRYLDTEAVRQKHAAINAGGVTHTFLWRLGDEDQGIWALPSVSR
ncbi:MAG: hypothetical protein IT200_08270 [Thermoleophilia bacterium]|nr:hypothetical protein [Thermoleophilia bacterium]